MARETLPAGSKLKLHDRSRLLPGSIRTIKQGYRLALIKGFPYYGSMNITLTLDDNLVKEIRKIAADRETTLTGMVRAYLEQVAVENGNADKKRKELELFEETFERSGARLNYGERSWRREDLYNRSSHGKSR
ncbi:MAG TPA: DUF6364 family protein [Verrucomicrobiae bacterium]|jgi:hypothetical protein|nr:DUF6364 family protein [Verrucomicrobiae bacterium]